MEQAEALEGSCGHFVFKPRRPQGPPHLYMNRSTLVIYRFRMPIVICVSITRILLTAAFADSVSKFNVSNFERFIFGSFALYT